MRRKHMTGFVVVFVVAVFGFVMTAGAAMAAQKSNEEKILEKVSQEGHTAMQAVRYARVAIFDGQPQQAAELLDKAKKNLSAAEKKAPEMTVTVKAVEKMGGKTIDTEKTSETNDLIPIDAGLALPEDFVATPEKTAKIKEANKHLKKGEKAKAVEVLHQADIGISVSRLLMPLKATINKVDKAISLIKEHKYYEANLALKGAEEGVIVDTVLLYEPTPPAKGKRRSKRSNTSNISMTSRRARSSLRALR